MNTITVDASMRSRLDNLESPLQFCNESGESLGIFVPAAEHHRTLSELPRQPYRTRDLCLRPAVRPAADQRPKSFWPG